MLSSVYAVTFKRTRKHRINNFDIRFFHVKKRLYFGFPEKKIDSSTVNVAVKEKALIDMLYFRHLAYSISIVWEKLNDYKHDIDFSLIKEYSVKYGETMIRKVGFLLEKLEHSADDIHKLVKKKTSYTFLSKGPMWN